MTFLVDARGMKTEFILLVSYNYVAHEFSGL